MSYDVDIGDYSGNYTYNLSGMIYDHMDGGLNSLNGLTGRQGYEKIMSCLKNIKKTCRQRPNGQPAWDFLSKKYDPDNHWGDNTGCILWLAELAYEFRERPRNKIWIC